MCGAQLQYNYRDWEKRKKINMCRELISAIPLFSAKKKLYIEVVACRHDSI
jgi:hypothetical protein